MSHRVTGSVAVVFLAACATSAAPRSERAYNERRVPMSSTTGTRTRASARITVQHSQAEAYDRTESPELVELRLIETFAGDLQGESPVRALQVRRDDRSARLVSMQRFRGKLAGREGTFVLQGAETVDDGRIEASWTVVPGSGTGELSGLRGEGGFKGEFGKGSEGTLDYWFE